MCKYIYTLILSLNVLSIETDLDVKLELKTVMDKIRTLSMGKNKEITVSQLILRLLICITTIYMYYNIHHNVISNII